MLANCPSCDTPVEEGHAYCPSCGTQVVPGAEAKPQASLSAILMASIGGMLAFFGLFFCLVGVLAEGGFLWAGLGACAIAAVLFLLAYLSRRRQLAEWRARQSAALSSASCSYCGYQNVKGARKCESCGAPL